MSMGVGISIDLCFKLYLAMYVLVHVMKYKA